MGSVGGLESESFGSGGQTWKWAPALVWAPRASFSALAGGGGVGEGWAERRICRLGTIRLRHMKEASCDEHFFFIFLKGGSECVIQLKGG